MTEGITMRMANGSEAASGYYDENGDWVETGGYYDENGDYIEYAGYYDENGEWVEVETPEGYYTEEGAEGVEGGDPGGGEDPGGGGGEPAEDDTRHFLAEAGVEHTAPTDNYYENGFEDEEVVVLQPSEQSTPGYNNSCQEEPEPQSEVQADSDTEEGQLNLTTEDDDDDDDIDALVNGHKRDEEEKQSDDEETEKATATPTTDKEDEKTQLDEESENEKKEEDEEKNGVKKQMSDDMEDPEVQDRLATILAKKAKTNGAKTGASGKSRWEALGQTIKQRKAELLEMVFLLHFKRESSFD